MKGKEDWERRKNDRNVERGKEMWIMSGGGGGGV